MSDPGQQYTAGGGGTYAEERRRRLRRDRIIGFVLCAALWVASVVPLARESMHGRGGAGAIAVFLAVGAITLGAAAALRIVYVLLRKRELWSPWLFVLAAVLALAGYLGQSAGPGGLISQPGNDSPVAAATR